LNLEFSELHWTQMFAEYSLYCNTIKLSIIKHLKSHCLLIRHFVYRIMISANQRGSRRPWATQKNLWSPKVRCRSISKPHITLPLDKSYTELIRTLSRVLWRARSTKPNDFLIESKVMWRYDMSCDTTRRKVRSMVFDVTFNNSSVILWRSDLLMGETGVIGENNRSAVSHW
jgi:hypothetical protein